MSELALWLNGDSAFAPPSHILESLTEEMARRSVAGAPHSIYAEVWHMAYWQQITLNWVSGIETACPASAAEGFPAPDEKESWELLRKRFLDGTEEAAALATDEREAGRLNEQVRCPSPAGKPARTMTVREQLESLASHNAYHLGRVVLLRQMLGSWPPPSGGFTW